MERYERYLLHTKQKNLLYSRRAYCEDDLRSVRKLLKAPDSVNKSPKDGTSLLHRACGNSNAALVRLLINSGANVRATDRSADTPLHVASSRGCLDAVQQLVRAGKEEENCRPTSSGTQTSDVSSTIGGVGWIGTKAGGPNHVDKTLSLINMTNFKFQTALDLAKEAGHVKVVDFLIQSGAASGDLLFACSHNNVEEVAATIRNTKTACRYVNVQSITGLSPLHYSTGSVETVRLLCDYGADPTLGDENGNTALHFVVESEDTRDIIATLVKNGAHVNARDCQGKTPLHHASIRLQPQVIECLLQAGADGNAQDNFGATPLHYLTLYNKINADNFISLLTKVVAVESVHVNGYSKYLKNKQDELDYLACRVLTANSHQRSRKYVKQNTDEMLDYFVGTVSADELISQDDIVVRWEADSEEHLKVMELILNTSNITNTKDRSGRTPLHIAAVNGHLEIAKYLLEKENADVCVRDMYGTTVLHEAVANGHLDMTRLILQMAEREQCKDQLLNCRERYRGHTPLHRAVQSSHYDVIDELLTSKADVNVSDFTQNTPLHAAIKENELELAMKLLSTGADANVQNAIGNTPLHEVICHRTSEKQTKILRFLHSTYGVDLNRQNNVGRTALHFAVWKLQRNVMPMRLLCELGARVDIADDYGNTPLHIMDHMTAKRLEILVRHGASVSAQNDRGMSPLHVACLAHRSEDCVNKLLEYGAKCNVVDAFGATPLHYACCQQTRYDTVDYASLVMVLLKHGANVNIQTKVSGKTPLHVAVENDEVCSRTLTQLIARTNWSTVDELGNSVSHCILSHRPLQCTDVLLKKLNYNLPRNYCGLTCLHLNAKAGLHEWMDSTFDDFVAMQDMLGRSCLHFHLACGNSAAKLFCDNVDLYYTTDFLQRNCFHHMCIVCPDYDKDGYTSYSSCLEPLSSFLRDHTDLINARDVYGRTALFYAAVYQHLELVNQLISAGADPNVVDNDGISPHNVITARKTNAVFTNTRVIIKDLKQEDVPTNDADKLPDNIYKVWESLQPVPANESYNRVLRREVTEFVRKLMEKVAELDPLFQSTPTLVGSALEGTRADREHDEFDFMIILHGFRELLDYSARHECFPAHIRLKQADEAAQHTYDKYSDATSVVQPTLLKERLYSLLVQACYYPHVWKNSPFEYLTTKIVNRMHSPAVAVKLSLNRFIDERQRVHFYRYHSSQISIDFVPAVATKWELSDNTDFGSYVKQQANAVDCRGFAVMKPHKYSIGNEADGFCPVIFIFPESEAIRQSATVRAAYTVIKWLLFGDKACEIGINKYALKTCVIQCVVGKKFRAEALHEDTEVNLIECIRVILHQLWKCVQEDGIQNLTNPDHYQPIWKFEPFAGFMKAYVSRYGLQYASNLFDPDLRLSRIQVPCDMVSTYFPERSKELIELLRESYRNLQKIREMYSVPTSVDNDKWETMSCSANIPERMRRKLVQYTIKYDDCTNKFHVNEIAKALLMDSPHRITI